MISVCMATYNGEKYLREQLDSILPQLGEQDEIVVSDDGSTDGTMQILGEYAARDSRVKVFANHRDKSQPGADMSTIITGNFVNALDHSAGEYIFFCDQDDVWMPGKVEKCMSLMRERKAHVVVHDCSVADGELNLVEPSYFRVVRMRPGFWSNFIKFRYIGCCMLVRRDVIDRLARPFVPGIYHDLWITLLTEVKGRVVPLEEPLLIYRRHGSNASNASEKSTNSLFKKLLIRIPFFYHVSLRLAAKMFTKIK